MRSAKISIITPFHDTRRDLFEKTVQSVVAQGMSREQLEWIIVFHNCGASYVAQAEELLAHVGQPFIKCVLNDSFRTPSAPRNLGLAKATGEYIYFLDSDDVLSQGFLEKARAELEQSGSDLVVAGARSKVTSSNLLPLPMLLLFYGSNGVFRIDNEFDEDCRLGRHAKVTNGSACRPSREVLGRLLYGAPVFLSTKLIRHKLIEDAGLRFDTSLDIIEDILFEVELYARAMQISVLTDACAYTYIQGEDSQLQRLVKLNVFQPDVIVRPVERIVSVCDEQDIDPNLFLWSIFEMVGAMALKGDLDSQAAAELKERMRPFAQRLAPVPFVGVEAVRSIEAMMAVAEVFLGQSVFEKDRQGVSLSDLIDRTRVYSGRAVLMEEGELSFAQLTEQSDAIAFAVDRARGALQGASGGTSQDASNRPVGLLVETSLASMSALLGIQKTGATLVILSPSAPLQRILQLVEQANVGIVVTQGAFCAQLREAGVETLDCDACLEASKEQQASPYKTRKMPEDSCALIEFTSGSEGVPKGVCFTRRNLACHLMPSARNIQVYEQVRSCDSILIHMGIDFLFGYLSAMEALTCGISLVWLANPGQISAGFVCEHMRSENIRVGVAAVPSVAAQWFADEHIGAQFETCGYLKFGGEGVSEKQLLAAQRHMSPDAVIVSGYATTETGPVCYGRISARHIGCGFPLMDTCVSILDDDLNSVPVGQRGRVCMSGNRVASGYLNLPVQSSFITGRTGFNHFISNDEGFLSPDGELHICGRMDRMLKVHGARIDPFEIERVLRGCAQINDAIVQNIRVENKECLFAFYRAQGEIDEQALRQYLSEHLPYYLMPDRFVQLDVFPVTERGKLDSARLIEMAVRLESQEVCVRQTNEVQSETDPVLTSVLAVFREIMQDETIGSLDGFFVRGGDSLKAIKLASQLGERGYLCTLQDVFVYPTPFLLAEHLRKVENKNQSSDISIDTFVQSGETRETDDSASALKEIAQSNAPENVDPDGFTFEASSTVRGYYEMQPAYREAFRYALRIQFTTTRCVDEAYVRARVDAISSRHPALRTAYGYVEQDGKRRLVGCVRNGHMNKSFFKDISHLSPEVQHSFIKGFWHVLDEQNAPFSVASIKTDEARYEVLVRIAHVFADALGSNLLLSDFMATGQIDESTRDDGFIASQKSIAHAREDIQPALSFFKTCLKDAQPARIGPAFDIVPEGTPITRRLIRVDAQHRQRIEKHCVQHDFMFNAYIQYLYGEALRCACAKDKIVFLCFFSGRTTQNLSTVGNFFHVLPVCIAQSESAQQFQERYLATSSYYYLGVDDIERHLRLPLRAIGCAYGINSNIMEEALDFPDVLEAKQVILADLKGVRMYEEGDDLVIEISYYQDKDTDGMYAKVEEKLRRMIFAKEMRI